MEIQFLARIRHILTVIPHCESFRRCRLNQCLMQEELVQTLRPSCGAAAGRGSHLTCVDKMKTAIAMISRSNLWILSYRHWHSYVTGCRKSVVPARNGSSNPPRKLNFQLYYELNVRHFPPNQSIEELITKTVPENIRLNRALDLDPALSEFL